jgi:hypothetical protein
MGPSPIYSRAQHNEPSQLTDARSLQTLMENMTLAEEQAISRIVPMLKIVSLKQGNLASRGNTTCVFQKSKLHTVLPNLPRECKYIIVKRKSRCNNTNNAHPGLKSTKFRRQVIADVLRLLKKTGLTPWANIEISQDRLDAWPEEGDLLTMDLDINVTEVDEDGNELEEEQEREGGLSNLQNNQTSVPTLHVGNDAGPAPLQNSVIPEETFEGLLPANDTSNVAAGQAHLLESTIQEALERIRTQDQVFEDGPPILSRNQSRATFNQPQLFNYDGGYVNMNKYPFAWALAFPTLFIPVYIEVAEGEWKWVILHDITGWPTLRDRPISINKWYEFMMWRGDGKPVKHPTFALVLGCHKTQNQLQRQGSYVLNTSLLNPNTLLSDIRNTDSNDPKLQELVMDIIKHSHIHSSNIPGLPAYWKSTYFEFMARNFFHSYIKNEDITVFHTGSLAEFHEPYLRLLLAKYVREISPDPTDDTPYNDILNDDVHFTNAVQNYKNVVTHYLASKMEIWMHLFMSPVYGLLGGNTSMEFANTRGAIHFHMTSYCNHPSMSKMYEYLRQCAEKVSQAMEEVNQYIIAHYMEDNPHFTSNPAFNFGRDSFKNREEFMDQHKRGSSESHQVWQHFLSIKQNAIEECARRIGREFESEFGIEAIHTGRCPQDWVKPGGFKQDDDYPPTSDDMQSHADVIDRRELKKAKVERELHLFERGANMLNHAFTHKCSDYCSRQVKKKSKYNPNHHKESDFDGVHLKRINDDTVEEMYRECKFGFGRQLLYETESGENNITRGKVPLRGEVQIELDGNGHPTLRAKRNHPRILMKPVGLLHYGANNDFQIMPINSTANITWQQTGCNPESYTKFANNLVAADMGGFDHYNGLHIVTEYLTKYISKGDITSQDWLDKVRSLTEAYCNIDGNQDKTVRSLIAKHMAEITNNSTTSKDKSVFTLAGGLLKRNKSGGQLRKCSVSAININELGTGLGVETSADATAGIAPAVGIGEPDPQVTPNCPSFTWSNITSKYMCRSIELNHLNLYKFVVYHWDNKEGSLTIPQFFGYDDTPTWPLKEEYSKWMLTFFKPWRASVDELKAEDGTFKTALELFMWDVPEFPWQIRNKLLRLCRNEVGVDLASGDTYIGIDEDFSPTDNRQNALNEEAQIAADNLIYDNDVREEEYEDFDDELVRTMNMRVPENHDWSVGHDEQIATALPQLKKSFYTDQMSVALHNHGTEPVKLLNEELYRPENAKTDGQKFLIYHHLYWQYIWYQHRNGQYENVPPMQTIYVEGLPGVGKTFLINTLRNICKNILQNNNADAASAPTGCAAALIDGSTHARMMAIPVGKDATKAPTHLVSSNSNYLQHLKKRFTDIFALFMDEHSMMGLQDWAWAKYRNEEFRGLCPPVMDEESNELLVDDSGNENVWESVLDPVTRQRPWGGIPLIYSFGDLNQLPPVAKKSTCDTKPPKTAADRAGRVAFHEFINTTESTQSMATIVVMDEVIRQRDATFLKILQNMRQGALDDDDINKLLSRVLDNLPNEEKQRFKSEGLYLVPTWKQANTINIEYIQKNFTTPIARYDAQLQTLNNHGRNCCIRETNLPMRTLLCKGAKVMLLENFIVEYKLMNGSVGVVQDLCFKQADGSQDDKMYVVVEFPQSTIPEASKMIPNKPTTWVPIPLVTRRCEKNCCQITALPLQLCKALTIHKAQGMTVGEGQMFEEVVVCLPVGGTKCPGQELVASSRAVELRDFAIGNPIDQLTKQDLVNIGRTPAYNDRRAFLDKIKIKSGPSQEQTRINITDLDTNTDKTFEGGCAFLLNWYRTTFPL